MSTPFYNVNSIEFRGNRMALKIDGKQFVFNLPEISKRLTAASKIEREKYDPSLPLALKIAKVFNKRVEEIFFLDEN